MSERDSIERLLARGARADVAEAAGDAARRFAERAAAEGAAAIAYTTIDTPVGTASIAATPRGVISVGLPNRALDDFLAELADEISPRIVEAPGTLDLARR